MNDVNPYSDKINPYLQAVANFAHGVELDGDDAFRNGTFDRFIERLARFLANRLSASEASYHSEITFDALTVEEFNLMCLAYGIDIENMPRARDYFVACYKKEYLKLIRWVHNHG